MTRSIFIPRWMDADNLNAQNKNAQLLLRHWPASDDRITTLAYNAPDATVVARKDVEIIRLWRRRGWMLHLFLRYFRHYDLVFYPGIHAADAAGLRWRHRLGFRAPVVATLEGLLGDEARQKEYSEWAGHPVYCQHVELEVLRRADEILQTADHVIAISPFLAEMGRRRYGDKFSVLPLGIDTSLYFAESRTRNKRPKIVSAGTFQTRKRPELFLELARRYPQADFAWFGNGGDVQTALQAQATEFGLINLSFPGALPPHDLGKAFRAADIFVMPSISEGVPKVTQEAAACGLAQVIFGYYEAPSVEDRQNGFVVWNDEEFMEKVGVLIENPSLAETFGEAGASMAKDWSWNILAPQWESTIKSAWYSVIKTIENIK